MPCPHCIHKPIHSFQISKREGNHAWFSTIDAKGLDRTPDYVIAHIKDELERYHDKEGKTWSWHYDAREFEFDFGVMNIFMQMLDILSKYSPSLRQIYIQPNDMLLFMLKNIHPLLPEKLKKLITFQGK